MKIIRLVVLCLVPFAVNAGESADKQIQYALNHNDADAVATLLVENPVNTDAILEKYIQWDSATYAVTKVLVDNSSARAIDAKTADKLYIKYIKLACQNGLSSNQLDFMQNLHSLVSWDYEPLTGQTKRDLMFWVAVTDEFNYSQCVFEQLAKYKLAKGEILDIAGEVAQQYNAKNLQATVDLINSEIAKVGK